MGLRGRLLILVLLAVMPALVTLFYSITDERRILTERVQNDALVLSETMAIRLGQDVEGIRQVLLAVGALPELRGDDGPVCNRLLANLLSQYPQYDNFGVVDADGVHFASALPFAPGLSTADRSWFKQVLATREFSAGEFQIGRITKKATLNFAYPLKAADGSLYRVLYGALDLHWLSQQLAREPLPAGAVITVFDRNGTVISRSTEAARWIGQSFPDAPLVQHVKTIKHGTAQLQGLDGVRRIYAFSEAGGVTRAFYVAVGIPRNIAMAQVTTRVRMDLMVLCGVTLLALVAAWIGGRMFIEKPIKTLIQAVDQMTGGNLDTRVAVGGHGTELTRLEASFNVMAQSLQKQVAERDMLARQRQLALDAARLGWWHYDPVTTIATWDDRYQEIFEVTGHERLNEEILARLHPDDLPGVWAKVEAALNPADPRPYSAEYRIRLPDGAIRWVAAHGLAVFEGDGGQRHAVSFVGTVEDVTERKRSEEELRTLSIELERRVNERTAQLATVNKELEAFSYSVSHDLRAPLRAVDGFSHALLEDYGERLDEEGKDYLKRMRAAASRMGHLIDDLMTLSRISRAELRKQTVDLSGLVRSILRELQEADPRRQVEIRVADNLAAEADPNLMRIALENLLGNAWKFTSKTPQAVIEFGRTEEDGHPVGGKHVVFYVRDNGVGFDMAYVGKLFGAFQRLHRMDEFPGTGIGLATVARIIHRHGGEVRAEGTPGRGATVYFTFESAFT